MGILLYHNETHLQTMQVMALQPSPFKMDTPHLGQGLTVSDMLNSHTRPGCDGLRQRKQLVVAQSGQAMLGHCAWLLSHAIVPGQSGLTQNRTYA